MKSEKTFMTSATLERPTRFDAKSGSPFIYTAQAGFQAVDTTRKLRLRFHIPSNMSVLQKVTFSFSGMPFRAGAQSTSGASSAITTSGGSAHSHTIDSAHQHRWAKWDGVVTTAPSTYKSRNVWAAGYGYVGTQMDSNAIMDGKDLLTDTTGGATGTSQSEGAHTHGMSHTHAVNAPDGLYETGMARNVHLYVDGVDVSTSVQDSSGNVGPWDGAGSEFSIDEIDISTYMQSGGFHEIQLSSTAIGGIMGFIDVIGLLQST
jgi:hypothetical protein